ncbi:hypothetical protein B0J17DRAFT_742572 [Rhizoctonia solani]|nr:hypothetical protein B0J17DRAFT_742572 [Rhizoctonia solani]
MVVINGTGRVKNQLSALLWNGRAPENFRELRRDYLWTTLGIFVVLWRTLEMGPHLGEFDQLGDAGTGDMAAPVFRGSLTGERPTYFQLHECWRFAMLIYLYMPIYNDDTHAPRMRRTQQGFMRLVRGAKPLAERDPDAHLSPPTAVGVVATISERDRDTLRQRILGIQEFAERGTVGNDYVLELEDVWARTKESEGRPGVWPDLKITYLKVTGR